MDDTKADIGLPPEADETPSESNRTESVIPLTATIESAPTLVSPTNGSSPRKIEANRRNAKLSTGPKTTRGKTISSWNSTRHGLLSKRLPFLADRSKRHFTNLLSNLQQDLEPVGTLEQVLVEKIAQEYWRLSVAAWHEADEMDTAKPFSKTGVYRVMRYQTTINRQLFQAMNQLERLQRLRKGDNVPPPLNLQVLVDPTGAGKGENHDP